MTRECEVCRSVEGVELEPTRTAYSVPEPNRFQRILVELGDELENPNQPSWLCRGCAKDYHEFWDEQWKEYYDSLL